MKILIVLVVLILIGAAGWYFLKTEAPTDDMQEAAIDENSAMDEAEMTSDAADAEPDTASEGTDAGMEFPTVDGDIDLSIDPDAKVFEVNGSDYAYDVKEIRVQEGDTVVINFSSADGFHDFVVDAFDARTSRVNTGQSSSVTFVADESGTFEYYCSVGNHRQMGMVGKLIVE